MERLGGLGRNLKRTLRRTARQSSTLRQLYQRLKTRRHDLLLGVTGWRTKLSRDRGGGRPNGLKPENMVWIFGSGRSGSTWLSSMMGEIERHKVWEEPLVGQLFGDFYERAPQPNLRSASFIMGDPVRRGWMRSIRNFVLDGAQYVHPGLGSDDYVVIKEPNGSAGAPLLMKALPESRMILLVRDPRDVVASSLDGASEGNWLYEWRMESSGKKRGTLPKNDPELYVRRRASKYVRAVSHARKAYDAHGGPKSLVRYEELRADALGTMRRLYSELGIPVNDEALARAVKKHSWENIPEGEKGEGKFYRKASPGGWRDDLTPEQARIVEDVTAPLLNELYPA